MRFRITHNNICSFCFTNRFKYFWYFTVTCVHLESSDKLLLPPVSMIDPTPLSALDLALAWSPTPASIKAPTSPTAPTPNPNPPLEPHVRPTAGDKAPPPPQSNDDHTWETQAIYPSLTSHLFDLWCPLALPRLWVFSEVCFKAGWFHSGFFLFLFIFWCWVVTASSSFCFSSLLTFLLDTRWKYGTRQEQGETMRIQRGAVWNYENTDRSRVELWEYRHEQYGIIRIHKRAVWSYETTDMNSLK